MDQLIGMGLQHFVPVVLALGCAAKDAFSVFPAVGDPLVANVALRIVKAGHGIHAVGVLAAINTASGEQAGQLGDGDAVKLMMKDVIDTLLQVGKDRLQSGQQPLGNLPQKDAAFAGGVQKLGVGVRKQLLREHIEHGVCHLRRREHLIVGQVGKAGQHIRIINAGIKIMAHLPIPSCNASHIS